MLYKLSFKLLSFNEKKSFLLKLISEPSNPEKKFLKFSVYNTKTEPVHYPIANDWFTKNVWPEVIGRHNNLTDDDYLLFPFVKDRNRLKQKTGKTWVRFAKDLNLYYHKGGTRPLYVLRHTYATELYKKGTSIDDIAFMMNTGPRMIRDVYLGHTNQSLINLAKRIPTRIKVIK